MGLYFAVFLICSVFATSSESEKITFAADVDIRTS